MLATGMADSSPAAVVGVDLGGTTIKTALVGEGYRILARQAVPTEVRSQRALLDAVERVVRSVAGRDSPVAVGFGLPSQIDQRHGRVLDSTNVPLEDIDFKAEMSRRLGLPVEIDNDANVACLAETRIGAARGARHVVMLTLGTGVGGGLVLDGELYRGSIGAGGELGHMSIDEDGPPCQGHCTNRGCLEVLASATGVMAAAQRIASERPHGLLAAAQARGQDLDAHFVIEAARQGEHEARDVFTIVGYHLGVGIANYANIFNPELFVIGGGISVIGDLLLEPARAEYQRRALRSSNFAPVVAAQLGNDAGVLGAAALVLPSLSPHGAPP
jgi:glucokinase